MEESINVGIIGASANGGWAKLAHVPAVQQLPGLSLLAVATSNQDSAEASARAFGAKKGYGNALELVRDPDVDLVVITVKVPDHRELVLAALDAGKHLYCEWPLGRNLAETQELAEAAQKAGVHVAIGLQARMNPAVQHARKLVASGAIGRVLTARLYTSAAAFGQHINSGDRYLEDAANGATLVSIQGGHALDTAVTVLGDIAELSALTTVQYPGLTLGDDNEPFTRTIPDQMLVQARLRSGAPLSLEVVGGRPADESTFDLTIIGETGTLVLEGGALRGFQSGRIRLSMNGDLVPVDEGDLTLLPDIAVNVGAVYEALRNDINADSRTSADFDLAVKNTRLVDAVLTSSDTGHRLAFSD